MGKKESQLNKFYAPCVSGKEPDTLALSNDGRKLIATPLSQLPGVKTTLAGGCLYTLAVEVSWFAIYRRLGLIRTSSIFVAACVAFAGITKITGGIDKVLLKTPAK